MKRHLIFVLVFIIVAPIWGISFVWSAMIANENDAIRYRFEKVLEGRLDDFRADIDRARAAAGDSPAGPIPVRELARGVGGTFLGEDEAVVLADGAGNVAFSWGNVNLVRADAQPKASIALNPPFGGYRLYYLSGEVPEANLNFHILVLAVACSLLIIGGYFFFEHMRVIEETTRKVSFVNQVSHELKTPLTNILLHAGLLKESAGPDDDMLNKAAIIEAEARRLDRLIDNVLSFSNYGRRRFSPRMQNVDDIVASVLKGFLPALQKKGMAVETSYAAGDASVDADIVSQILANLVGNAEKYAGDGGYLGVSTFRDADKIRIRVSDKGQGVPRAYRKRIFEPFVRAADDATEGASGTGIGLALARNLARLHGGDLRLVDSREGACFEVTL